ncbi:MAG: hypothetical protein IJU76_11510 [Desulfovibrionaceae bacterium]|nr:hypothetical protein [Desulfovibrionaceae bacterium]
MVLELALIGSIIPLLSVEIMAEYENVFRRKKFSFKEQDIQVVTEGSEQEAYFLILRRLKNFFQILKILFFMLLRWRPRKTTMHTL